MGGAETEEILEENEDFLLARDRMGRLLKLSKVHASLAAMSKGLGDKPFFSGIHFSLSDIAVGCALGYLDFRFAHIDWRTEHPNLARLYEKLVQRQSFIDTAPPAA